MKLNTLLLLSFTFLLISCEKEEDPVNTTKKYLSIVPTIENRSETKAGVVSTFKSADRIGVFISGTTGTLNNIPAEFNGTGWDLKEIEGAQSVQGYFPYSAEYESVEAVKVDVNEQTDFLYSENTSVSNNVARLKMKHAMSLVSVVIKKNDYNYDGKVTQLEIEGIPTAGLVNLKSGATKTGEPMTYKRTLNYTLDDYNTNKISTIVLPITLIDMKEVTFRVTIDGDDYAFPIPSTHVWEAGKEYTYTLNVYETFKPNVLEVIPVDVSYWNTYGKTDKITILEKPNMSLWFHSGATHAGKMTVKGEGQIFGGRITNKASASWEGQWRYGMFDMSGNLIELYQAYNITIPAKDYNGGYLPCFIDCAPGKYQALPLLKDKGTDYWYVPRLEFEGLDEYTVLPSSANTTPSIRSVKMEGWYEAYSGNALYDLNAPFSAVLTITNRAGIPLKGDIKAVWERSLSTDYIPYPFSYLQIEGHNTEQWADEVGRMSIDYTSDVTIKQELMNCVISKKRPQVDFCGPVLRWYFKSHGSNDWILMRCDYDYQFEQLKGIIDVGEPSATLPKEDCLNRISTLFPATNYAGVLIKE